LVVQLHNEKETTGDKNIGVRREMQNGLKNESRTWSV
jgi:hypothetical protein